MGLPYLSVLKDSVDEEGSKKNINSRGVIPMDLIN